MIFLLIMLINCRINELKLRRFSRGLSSPSVRMLRFKEITFVLVNSMAFEGDGCDMCHDAQLKLSRISHTLNCAQVHTYNAVMPWLHVQFLHARIASNSCSALQELQAIQK